MENLENLKTEQSQIEERLADIGKLISNANMGELFDPNSNVAILAKEAWSLKERLDNIKSSQT